MLVFFLVPFAHSPAESLTHRLGSASLAHSLTHRLERVDYSPALIHRLPRAVIIRLHSLTDFLVL